jgi:flagellar hook-associated protein 2
VEDFLPGVNLHLKGARPDQPFTLTISEDMAKIGGKVKTLVEQLNGILGFITKQNEMDKDTDTSSTFGGDSGLQTIEFRLRNLMHEHYGVGDPDSDNFQAFFLSDLGIEFEKSGQLTFKEDKFEKVMEKNFNAMSEVISGPTGFGRKLQELMTGLTRTGDGFLAIRDNSLRTRIKDIDTQIDTKNSALEKKQEALVNQFSRLEGSLSDMQKQQQYLQASMGGQGGGTLAALLGG